MRDKNWRGESGRSLADNLTLKQVMSEDLEKFRQIVLHDKKLQAQLRSIAELGEFVRRIVAEGSGHGLVFDANDVNEAMRENRRRWIERWM